MNEENIPELKPKKRIRKVIMSILCVIILVGIGIVWQMQKPSQGIIKQSPAQTSSATAPSKEKIRIDGEYLSFAYLSSYNVAPQQKELDSENKEIESLPQSPFLQSHFLVFYSAASSKKIAVSVERLESGNLEDNASFKFRISTPKLYTQSMIEIGDEKAILFTREADMYEQTIFIKHNGLVATIALSSSNADLGAMKEELLAVAKSVNWK